MIAAEIAAALGNARREGHAWRCRCPLHGGHSLVLADGRNALLVKCWAGCDVRDVLAELHRLQLTSVDRRTEWAGQRFDDQRDRARRIEIARRIWDGARDARGSLVACYIASRGIIMPIPPSLRWAPSSRRPDGTHAPAMLARADSLDGELIGVHRTYLDRDVAGLWHRRDRASLGPIAGGAVRLAPVAEMLLIGEGIETVLAAMQATGLPGWAALSTSGLKALLLPPEVRSAVICADNDDNGAGERAARTAERRWRAEGREVQIYISPYVGEDAADRLLAMSEARHAA